MRPTHEPARNNGQTYFVTFQTAQRRPLFRHERWANAFLEILKRYSEEYGLHDFVIMPDHVHLLVSPNCPLERIVQLIKGGYSFTAKRAFQWKGDIWQAGFTDHRIRDEADWVEHLAYIEKNVVSLRLPDYKFCGKAGGIALSPIPPRLKPQSSSL